MRIISFVVALVFLFSPAMAQSVLTFSAIQDSDNSEISALVLKEAYKKIGIDVYITPFPAKRSLFYANEGMADGELFRINGMEKKFTNLIRVPVAINQLEAMVMTKSADFTVSGWQSLTPYKLAIRRGVKFSEIGTEGMRRVTFNNNLALGRILLENSEVDVSVIARVNGLQVMEELGDKALHFLQPPLNIYPLFHYLHKKHEKLVPKLVTVLEDMKEKGRMDEIRNTYLARKYPSK